MLADLCWVLLSLFYLWNNKIVKFCSTIVCLRGVERMHTTFHGAFSHYIFPTKFSPCKASPGSHDSTQLGKPAGCQQQWKKSQRREKKQAFKSKSSLSSRIIWSCGTQGREKYLEKNMLTKNHHSYHTVSLPENSRTCWLKKINTLACYSALYLLLYSRLRKLMTVSPANISCWLICFSIELRKYIYIQFKTSVGIAYPFTWCLNQN